MRSIHQMVNYMYLISLDLIATDIYSHVNARFDCHIMYNNYYILKDFKNASP